MSIHKDRIDKEIENAKVVRRMIRWGFRPALVVVCAAEVGYGAITKDPTHIHNGLATFAIGESAIISVETLATIQSHREEDQHSRRLHEVHRIRENNGLSTEQLIQNYQSSFKKRK